MESVETSDASLVTGSLAGNREAFSQIVARYQTLICSLAYSSTGSLSQSEDLAQETFIAAWKQLGSLREPHKLRPWLCRIARNLTCDALRQQGREPIHRAETLDETPELHSPGASPVGQAISNEEESLMWRLLETIPPDYREPLVLFYREGQSVEKVAAALDLSEETVRQRLSRGRVILSGRMMKTVEGALFKSAPGKVFTLTVLASLSALTVSAKAAAVGTAAVKGGATAKVAALTGFSGAILGSLLIFLGNYAGYRLSLDAAHSDEERRHIKSFYRKLLVFVFICCIAFVALMCWASFKEQDHSFPFGLVLCGWIATYLLALFVFVIATLNRRRKYLAGVLAQGDANDSRKPAWEYRSRLNFLGLPLVHICVGDRFAALKNPVTAWIAVGDCAIGGLFAFGGVAVAPVSIGGFAIGLLPLGGLAAGLLAVGGTAVGVWAFGSIALGWQAFGGCAVAWNAAVGGVALAHDFALGGIAHAMQANTESAASFIRAVPFFRNAHAAANYCIWLNLIWVVPLVVQWRIVARRIRLRRQQIGL